MRRSDWTLLALGAAGGHPVSPVQLQKVLFLLGRECAEDVGHDFYDFQPYNYGPFDSTIYSDAEALERAGLVARLFSPPRSWAEYAVTTAGLERAEQLRAQAPKRAVKYLDTVVEWARGLTFEQLVRAVYQRYPDTRARSIFRG